MSNLINKLNAAIMESTQMVGQPLQMGELGDQMPGAEPMMNMGNPINMGSPVQIPMGNFNQNTEDSYESEESESIQMIKADLKTLIRNAQQMLDSINSSMEIEEWAISKVTLATDYIVSANQYMLSESENGSSIKEMKEAPMLATPKITMDMVKPTGPTMM